jgi:hypothetical protein
VLNNISLSKARDMTLDELASRSGLHVNETKYKRNIYIRIDSECRTLDKRLQ